MQRQHKDGERPRISVSLDPKDHAWVQSFDGPSDSYKVSRIISAARKAGIRIDDAKGEGMLGELRDWLKTRRRKSAIAREFAELLDEFLKSS